MNATPQEDEQISITGPAEAGMVAPLPKTVKEIEDLYASDDASEETDEDPATARCHCGHYLAIPHEHAG